MKNTALIIIAALFVSGCATIENPAGTDDRIVWTPEGEVLSCSYFDGEAAKDPNCLYGLGCLNKTPYTKKRSQ
jgi:hypothetical protein